MSYEDEYAEHMLTWGPHCGAPKSVYKGHLDKLLRTALDAVRERCAKMAEDERVPGETGTAEDAAYNAACEHIAAAIRRQK